MASYPARDGDRDGFVLARREPRPWRDPWLPPALTVERERTREGVSVPVATAFLTGRECPWRCVMCDLWRGTTVEDTPRGAIAAQVRAARAALRDQRPFVRTMKLYNSGSFFDPRAVPDADYEDIAVAVSGLERLIVESHPALVGPRLDRLLDALQRRALPTPPRLEVAMGLETAHPDALERLNKRMSVPMFSAAAAELRRRDVDLRVFLLVRAAVRSRCRTACLAAAIRRPRPLVRRVRRLADSDPFRERCDGGAGVLGSLPGAASRRDRAGFRGRARRDARPWPGLRRRVGSRTLQPMSATAATRGARGWRR